MSKSTEEFRGEVEKLLHQAVQDLGMSVLFRDSDPIETGVGDKNPPYYWTDKFIQLFSQEPERSWWVAKELETGVFMKVLGPFTSSADAGVARQFIELSEGNHNYWIKHYPDALNNQTKEEPKSA